MLTIKQWMEIANYRITEGSEYGWSCYGSNTYNLSTWDGSYEGVSSDIIFDTKTQEVYQSTVCDFKREHAYRWINPDFKKRYINEATDRSTNANQAWDDVNYVDLETVEDFIAKATAIMNYQEYDERVSIPVELPDKELLVLFKLAHENDMTFNQFVEKVLREQLPKMAEDLGIDLE